MQFLSGRKERPSKKEMLADTEAEMQRRWNKGYKKRQAHMMGTDQVCTCTDNSTQIIKQTNNE